MQNEVCFFFSSDLISSGKNAPWILAQFCVRLHRVKENKSEKYWIKEIIIVRNVTLMRHKFFKFFWDVIYVSLRELVQTFRQIDTPSPSSSYSKNKHIVSSHFTVTIPRSRVCCCTVGSQCWEHRDPPKRRKPLIQQDSVTSQKTWIQRHTGVLTVLQCNCITSDGSATSHCILHCVFSVAISTCKCAKDMCLRRQFVVLTNQQTGAASMV